MTNETRSGQRKARVRFAALYLFSLVLMAVIISAFWRRLSPANQAVTTAQAPETEMYFMQMDTLLHQRMERLDAVYASAVEAKQRGQEATPALQAVRREFVTVLDSLDQQASYLNDGPKKGVMTMVSAKFRRAFDQRERTVNGVLQLPAVATTTTVGASSSASATEIENLKKQLQEKDARIALLSAASPTTGTGQAAQQLADKDKTIAQLQTQLRQKEAALQAAAQGRPVATSGGEWQQKYNTLKASFDKASANEKSLKNAYQSLADDNRRLLSQIQAMRKN